MSTIEYGFPVGLFEFLDLLGLLDEVEELDALVARVVLLDGVELGADEIALALVGRQLDFLEFGEGLKVLLLHTIKNNLKISPILSTLMSILSNSNPIL